MMAMNPIAENELFKKNMGEVLGQVVWLERIIEEFIAEYFVVSNDYKRFLFHDAVLIDMGFEKKVNLFKQICEREKYDSDEVRQTIAAIKHIQKVRNAVAHWQPMTMMDGRAELWKRTALWGKTDAIKLDEEGMKEFNRNGSIAAGGVFKLRTKFSTIYQNPDMFK